ncbi:ABC transporter permease [Bittarella massiliensis (ex Durand et al. 2017)]|uniref:ABC transporter permease n=1 Tax=Bittarella massiliensis (ex Durand et al. 2017) TaxID=1720313 RepID=UPI001AA11331|nr:ABC transporter permease [Bittarella massiliensis (ex Durand et al. 2017)]MBO1680024.1 ABC transporter permease [Bittarella massiliensis (ex Durand et al. 2017)]
MYLHILKKDLRRKKTMNAILLVFIALAATFIASSAGNLISISTALDGYFDRAGLGDFTVVTANNGGNDGELIDFLNGSELVESWGRSEHLYLGQNLSQNGEPLELQNTGILSSLDAQLTFFDSENRPLTAIEEGTIYLPLKVMEDAGLNRGDTITLRAGALEMDFTVAGNVKDAFLGSTMMGSSRLLVSREDYQTLVREGDWGNQTGAIYSVKTGDAPALQRAYNRLGFQAVVACDRSLVATTYVMDTVVAAALLAVSVCLILISLVILRFTITFTLEEEYREIGIMKAIGIPARKIRGLYLVKYLAIALVGAGVGFFASIPFGNLFLERVGKNIVLPATGGGELPLHLLCCALIVALVASFCYLCTRRIGALSPIDAIRSGKSGERFHRKGALRLSRGRMPVLPFLALGDIFSGFRRFAALLITFTIGIVLIIVPVNTVNTLSSGHLIDLFGMTESDLYLDSDERTMEFLVPGGREKLRAHLRQTEETLAQEGMPADCWAETLFRFRITFGEESTSAFAIQGTGVDAGRYTYTGGSAPAGPGEVALTHITADAVGARIGDRVKIKIGGEEKPFLVTAIYQSMNNLGEGIRFSEEENIDYQYGFSGFATQVAFRDRPGKREIDARAQQLKTVFPREHIYTGAGYVSYMMGDTAGQVDQVKQLIVAVILAINALVALLMMKSFLTREKGEIGMLKSLGFRDGSIIAWQVLRVGIVLAAATLLGAALSGPIAQLSAAKAFEMMGASHVEFIVRPLEVYLLYPLLVLAVTLTVSALAALPIRRISPRETNNIE